MDHMCSILHQEEDDKEYESEVSESDYEDSDISIDENDEVKSDAVELPCKKTTTLVIPTYIIIFDFLETKNYNCNLF